MSFQNVLTNQRSCSAAEVGDLRRYLSETHMRLRLPQLIDRGAAVSKAGVKPLDTVGNLRTYFKNIGGIVCQTEHGAERFLVRQVVPTLHKANCIDKERLKRIELYRKLYASKRLELIVTLSVDGEGLVIYDGNTRTVAVFEYGQETGQTDLGLPVYVVTPQSSSAKP
jgi:hypothetical protein